MKIRVIFFMLSMVVIASCGRSSSSSCSGGIVAPGCDLPMYPIESVLVSPINGTVKVGGTLQMTVAVTTPDLTYAVTWSSANATAAGVDSTGLVTGKAASSGVSICATMSAVGYADVESCATVVATP